MDVDKADGEHEAEAAGAHGQHLSPIEKQETGDQSVRIAIITTAVLTLVLVVIALIGLLR